LIPLSLKDLSTYSKLENNISFEVAQTEISDNLWILLDCCRAHVLKIIGIEL